MFETRSLKELKIQARRLSKGKTPTDSPVTDPMLSEKLPHTQALQHVAVRHGFRDWQHAHRVFSGQSSRGEDQGKLWHGNAVMGFLNHWFADYAEACTTLKLSDSCFLLPYQTQYLLVEAAYLQALGFTDLSLWYHIEGNLVAAYGSEAWDQIYLVYLRSQAIREKSLTKQ